jgi:hypothetical protein
VDAALTRRLLALALLAGPSCDGASGSGGPDCDAPPREPARCDLGTGSTTWKPVADGEPLPFFQGAQGGLHVYGSFRVAGIVPVGEGGKPPLVRFQLVDPGSGEAVGGYDGLRRPLKTRQDGTLELVGDVLVLAFGSPEEAIGRPVRFEVEVEDACGSSASDERDVVLVPGS